MPHAHPVLPTLLTLLFLAGLPASCSAPQATARLPTQANPLATLPPTPGPVASPGVPATQSSLPGQPPTETNAPSAQAPITIPYLLPTPVQPLGGGAVQDGPFTFDLRLHRDPAFGANPVAPSLYSDLEGIGLYSVWRYEGPDLAAPVAVYWGVEPASSELLSQAGEKGVKDGDSDGRDGGLILPQGSRAGDGVRAILKIETAGKTYGAVLSFTLKEGEQGLEPADVAVQPLGTSQ